MPVIPTPQQQYQPVPTQPAQRREKGTGFTNIGRMLQANVGAAGQMGQGVGQGIGKKAGELQQDVTKSAADFQRQYQQQYGQTLGEQGSLGQARQMIPGQGGMGNVAGMTEAQASEMAKNISGAQYTGPVQYENEQQLLNKAANLQALAQASQAQLLQGVGMRTGPYTMGETIFDVGLMSQDPAAQRAIQQQKQAAANLAAETGEQAQVATQRAEALGGAVESEKAGIRRDVLANLAGMQEQAKLKAQNYLSQAGRIKDILVGNIPESEITPQDRAMMADLSRYGVENINFDTSEEDINKQILQAISASGQTAFTDQSMFDQSDKNLARNLALISGDKNLAKRIEQSGVNEQVFAGSKEGIKTQTDILEQKRAEEQAEFDRITNALNSYSGMFTGEKPGDIDWMSIPGAAALDSVTAGVGGIISLAANLFSNAEDDINTGFDAGARGSYVNMARDILGSNQVDEIRNKWYSRAKEQGFLGLGGSEIEDREAELGYLKEIQDTLINRLKLYGEKLERRKKATTSLQDYINQRFGVGSVTGVGPGPAPVQASLSEDISTPAIGALLGATLR